MGKSKVLLIFSFCFLGNLDFFGRCLNWEGMGARVEGDADGGSMEGTFSLPDVKFTNNNGMKATVELLEAIYTKADFPPAVAPYLSVSLKVR